MERPVSVLLLAIALSVVLAVGSGCNATGGLLASVVGRSQASFFTVASARSSGYKRVPDVYNRSPSDARATWRRAGFRTRVTRQTRQSLREPGAVVMMQAPRAGDWLV